MKAYCVTVRIVNFKKLEKILFKAEKLESLFSVEERAVH